MPELIIDFITSLDGYASAEGWPGWWGLEGPEYLAWLDERPDRGYTILMGANTYRLMYGFAGESEASESEETAEDDAMAELTRATKMVFSSTLKAPVSWANTTLVSEHAVEAVAAMKRNGSNMSTLGSLSLCRSLLEADLVDLFRVVVFPVITGKTGRERIYDGYPDVALDMVASRTFDGRIQLLSTHPRCSPALPARTPPPDWSVCVAGGYGSDRELTIRKGSVVPAAWAATDLSVPDQRDVGAQEFPGWIAVEHGGHISCVWSQRMRKNYPDVFDYGCRFRVTRFVCTVKPNSERMLMAPGLDFEELDSQLTGEVVTPEHEGYDDRRQLFYGNYDPRPAAIARVVDASEVARVLKFTADIGLDVSIRSGGHSPAGSSVVDDAVVIDVRGLDDIDIDPDARTVWAGSGVTAAGLSNALGEHRLALGFGDTGSVGIGGITLGGGVGLLSRRHGLTIDSLLAAEVVTASGDVIVADAANHPDLFWAIRGGGGNFGVVPRFKYSAQPIDRIIGGIIVLPATPETVVGFLELSDGADDLSTIANVMSAPPMPFLPEDIVGETVILGLVAWCGDLDEGQAVMDRFRSLAEPLADFVDEIPYAQIFPPDEEEYRPTAIGRTGFVDSIEPAAIDAVFAAIDASDAPLRAVQIRAMGGAISRIGPEETAFAHRNRRWMVNVASFYETEDVRSRRETWVKELFMILTGGDEAGYVGFLDNEGEDRVRAAYPGDTWDRLREVKSRYDPDNRFHHNQNIPPADGRLSRR